MKSVSILLCLLLMSYLNVTIAFAQAQSQDRGPGIEGNPVDKMDRDLTTASAEAAVNGGEPQDPEEAAPLGSCTQCPAGCLSEGYVKSFRNTSPSHGDCPVGCWPFTEVIELREKPLCDPRTPLPATVVTPRQPEKPTPEAAKPEPEKSDDREVALVRSRVMFQSTAIGLKPSQVELTGFFAGWWDLQVGLHENLQIGVDLAVPALVYAVFPSIQVHVAASEHFHASLRAFGGVLGMFTVYESSIWSSGVQGNLTLHYGNHVLNFTQTVALGGLTETRYHRDEDVNVLLLPSVGYTWAFSKRWMFVFEFTSILRVHPETRGEKYVPLFLIYGVRGHGDLLFGDIGLVRPIVANGEEFNHFANAYFPIGIPYFSLGFRF